METAIKGATLIKGIFRELFILSIPIKISNKDGYCCEVLLAPIIDDAIRNVTENNGIKFLNTDIDKSYLKLEFELDDICYQCDVKLGNILEKEYQFPEEIRKVYKRSTKRIALKSISSEPLFVELRGVLWRYLGIFKNSDHNHINAIITTSKHNLIINEKIHIRTYSQEREIQSSYGVISFIRYLTNTSVEVVVNLISNNEKTKIINRNKRYIPKITFNLKCYWPDENGIKFELAIVNVGVLGFSGHLLEQNNALPPIGSICWVYPYGFYGRLVWINAEQVGFDLRINNKEQLNAWHSALDELYQNSLSKLSKIQQQRKILSIFLRSGYLRGKKAKLFKDIPGLEKLIPNSQNSNMWIKRYSSSYFDNAETHISFLRGTDTSWIMQELASAVSGRSVGDELLSNSMRDFAQREEDYIAFDSKFIAIYDPSSKFHQNYWNPKSKKGGITTVSSVLLDLTNISNNQSDDKRVDNSIEFFKPTRKSWRNIYNELIENFPIVILDGLGLTKTDYRSPELKQCLMRSGYQFDRKLVLMSRDDRIIGFLLTLGLPFLSNIIATSNHLWIVLSDHKYFEAILGSISKNDTLSDVFLGITESIILPFSDTEVEQIASELNGNVRSVIFLPIFNVDEFLDA